MADPYCYPGTNVLKNRFHIRDKNELYCTEIELTYRRLKQLENGTCPVKGSFDFRHLKDLHYFIFQDLYEWAGEIRTVDIGKENLFCRPANIESYAASIFRNYAPHCRCRKNRPNEFVHALAEHYGDLNACHPFREGNGRTQRAFAMELCRSCGYDFDLSETTHEEMLKASIRSFNTGDNRLFERIFQKAVHPVKTGGLPQKTKPAPPKILSKNDLSEQELRLIEKLESGPSARAPGAEDSYGL